MDYKCPNCANAIMYNIEKDRMVCDYCSSEYRVDELNAIYNEKIDKLEELHYEPSIPKPIALDEDKSIATMDVKIYSCSSCGAQISLTDVETSTYCAFCGQPKIIFHRIEKKRKPDYIIPFSITKHDAYLLIKEEIKHGFFSKKTLLSFKENQLRGIYVPYWVYDIFTEDAMIIATKRKSKELYNEVDTYEYATDYYRHGTVHVSDILIESSERFNDDLSRTLLPFDTSKKKEFSPAFLSGFYSDYNDTTEEVARKLAFSRAKERSDKAFLHSVLDPNLKEISMQSPKLTLCKSDYYLMPVWFASAKYKSKTYIYMVNGQTGKVVATVPHEPEIVKERTIITTAVISILIFFMAILYDICNPSHKINIDVFKNSSTSTIFLLVVAFICFILYSIADYNMDKVKKHEKISSEAETIHYVKNREEGL